MKTVEIIRCKNNNIAADVDVLADEEALSIDVVYGPEHNRNIYRLSTTMRTPGNDTELALGLLYSLGIIGHIDDILEISLGKRGIFDPSSLDQISVHLRTTQAFLPLDFSFGHPRYSSCGLCGGGSLPTVNNLCQSPNFFVTFAWLKTLPQQMIRMQNLFQKTGGVHAAMLFDESETAVALFEDVGRHNALDKLIGSMVQKKRLPLEKTVLLLSSRASYEIIQKAALANIPVVAVMGAVSSIAVELAHKSHLSLIGFLRSDRLNVYTHRARIV